MKSIEINSKSIQNQIENHFKINSKSIEILLQHLIQDPDYEHFHIEEASKICLGRGGGNTNQDPALTVLTTFGCGPYSIFCRMTTTYIHIHTHIHIYIYIHTYVHTYIDIYVCIMYHVSCIMCHVSCIMHHVSCTMYHASCIMYHVPCIMHHVSCIMYRGY